jgi:menaquinone-9 beta-reductase
METRRAIVIGAGPAGGLAALTLAQHSIETLLLEQKTLPRPKTCAGGISPWALDLLDSVGLRQRVSAEAHPVHAALVHGPAGAAWRLRGRLQAAVLPRARFDELLVGAARQAGAELREGIAVAALARDGGRVIGVQTAQGPIEADAVVVATGAHGRFAPRAAAGDRFFGILARYVGMEDVSDIAEFYLDPDVRPHYGWVFPEGEGRANVGVCFRRRPSGPNALQLLDRLIDRHLASRLRHAERVGRVQAHPIAAVVWPPRLVEPGAVYVGEAAGLVDPLSGEGIYYAMSSGRLAGEQLAIVLRRGERLDAATMRHYIHGVRRRIVPRLAISDAARRLLASSPLFDLAGQLMSIDPLRTAFERIYPRL